MVESETNKSGIFIRARSTDWDTDILIKQFTDEFICGTDSAGRLVTFERQ